jgi:hypothetical protein
MSMRRSLLIIGALVFLMPAGGRAEALSSEGQASASSCQKSSVWGEASRPLDARAALGGEQEQALESKSGPCGGDCKCGCKDGKKCTCGCKEKGCTCGCQDGKSCSCGCGKGKKCNCHK